MTSRDAGFLHLERPHVALHIGWLAVLAGGLHRYLVYRGESAWVGIDALLSMLDIGLHAGADAERMPDLDELQQGSELAFEERVGTG